MSVSSIDQSLRSTSQHRGPSGMSTRRARLPSLACVRRAVAHEPIVTLERSRSQGSVGQPAESTSAVSADFHRPSGVSASTGQTRAGRDDVGIDGFIISDAYQLDPEDEQDALMKDPALSDLAEYFTETPENPPDAT